MRNYRKHSLISWLMWVQIAMLALSGAYAVLDSGAFMKSNTIVKARLAPLLDLEYGPGVDIAPLMAHIPYGEKTRFQPNGVDPRQRLDDVLASGKGDCSVKAHALAYYLEQRDIDYQLVHILIPEKFMDGKGHVTMNTTFQLDSATYNGIVDIYEGGLPVYQNRFINISDMMRAHIPDDAVRIHRLSERVNENARYYGSFLEGAVIGITPAWEVNSYFAWSQKYYLPFGNKTLEQYLYEGLGLMLGEQPRIYVEPADWERLYGRTGGRRELSQAVLWAIRVLLITLPLTVLVLGFRRLTRRGAPYASH